MSLSYLHRVSCVIFPRACSCKSIRNPIGVVVGKNSAYSFTQPIGTNAMYCSTALKMDSTSSGPKLERRKTLSSKVRMSSSKNNDNNNSNKMDVTDPSVSGKLKAMWKNYGTLAIGTYLCIYVSTLSSIFLALDFDVFNAATFGLDAVSAVNKVCDLIENTTGSTSIPAYIRTNPRVGTFAIAWVMTKFTEPIRLGVTLATVPSISRFIAGWNGLRQVAVKKDLDPKK
eukprot:gene8040-10895_t